MDGQDVAHGGTYDVHQTYEWNYQNGPVFDGPLPVRPENTGEKVELLGFKLNSRIGVPAGPLLNSNWIKLYAELGFDILTYKTVRTVERKVHPAPNCVYVNVDGQLSPEGAGARIVGDWEDPEVVEDVTITNSFGMPSLVPTDWMDDIRKAKSYLKDGQVLSVSVVGTPGEGESFAADFAKCAALAKEAGADIIEANYSCPNVCTGEGSIFMNPESSADISRAIKEAIGDTPLFIKVGYFATPEQMEAVVKANAPYVDGIAGINTIAMEVVDKNGEQALPGEGRLKSGLCGHALNDAGLQFTKDLVAMRERLGLDFVICSVGGITYPKQFDERFAAGAELAMVATGAMWNPLLASQYHALHI